MNYNNVDHFIAVSYLYFLVTDKNASSISREELDELIIAINETNKATQESENHLV